MSRVMKAHGFHWRWYTQKVSLPCFPYHHLPNYVATSPIPPLSRILLWPSSISSPQSILFAACYQNTLPKPSTVHITPLLKTFPWFPTTFWKNFNLTFKVSKICTHSILPSPSFSIPFPLFSKSPWLLNPRPPYHLLEGHHGSHWLGKFCKSFKLSPYLVASLFPLAPMHTWFLSV